MSTNMSDLDKKIQDAEELKSKYARKVDAVDQLLQALQEQKLGLEHEIQALAVLEQPMPTAQPLTVSRESLAAPDRVKSYGKPNTQLYEEVILDHGRPMHMSDILEESLNRGLVLQGRRTPMVQIRGALANCKRLYNVGGNTWWITDKVVPEEPASTNGYTGPFSPFPATMALEAIDEDHGSR